LNELNEDKKKYQIELSLIEGVGDVIGKKLLAFTGSAKAVFFAQRNELEKIEGIGKVQCEDAPLNFFYKGDIDWNKDKFISIVGTRKASSFGKQFMNELVKELAPYNPVIVSGLAS